ncbi:MAG: hypothetical protein JRI23_22440 [Deltaproteobacteria bacterium]|jgi:pyruvate/2-oxoglutarate dehydrogenase complex dihydrolipoamide acyltransferase (E2) component|nr:hypothetical protein [Deltaproteobacteria bacterium]MBW2534706.1 hypothetical protein [Deltaproteobacteria bacterium]
MDPKQAVMTLLAAAGVLAATDGHTQGMAEGPAAEPGDQERTSPRAGAEHPIGSGQRAAELSESKLPALPDAPPAVMRYGIVPRPAKSAGATALATAARQANRVAEALRVVATPAGRKAAEKAGLTAAKIAEQRTQLRAFDQAAAQVGCKVALPMGISEAPVVVMKYGIIPLPSCSSGLTAARQQARRVSDALRVLSTQQGLAAAKRAGLSTAKIAEVKAKLVAFDTKVIALRCP